MPEGGGGTNVDEDLQSEVSTMSFVKPITYPQTSIGI